MSHAGRNKWGMAGTYTGLTLASVVAVFPVLWIVISSLKTATDLNGNPISLIPQPLTFDNYVRVFTELGFHRNLLNSLVISVASTAITIIISSLGAYGIVRFFPNVGRKMTRVLIVSYMFPPILLAVPFTLMLAQVGLVNSYLGLIVIYLSFSVPYALWMLVGFYQTVPISIEEAAAVDGAGRMRVFLTIASPIVLPGIVATTIYTFINTFNEFLYALLFINESAKMPVSVGLYSLMGTEVLDWGMLMAASTLVVLPSVIVFMIIQKYMAAGLSEGSVK